MTHDARRVFRVDLTALPPGAKVEGTLHTRGWLSLEPAVSVRVVESPDDGRKAYTNQAEHADKPTPGERERRIEVYEANELLEKAVAAITKTRYRIKVSSLLWDLDEYLGPYEGLWLASVELEPGEEFVKPKWLLDEVTGEAAFDELAMAGVGRPPA
jgi:CYTH domain-containing protein